MTSNQINYALEQEQERHNKEQESLNQEELRITEERNKAEKRYQTAMVFINAANAFNNAGSVAAQSQANAIKATQVAAEAQIARERNKISSKMNEIEESKMFETARHNREAEKLTLQDADTRSYLAQLQAKQNQFTRQQQLFENEQTIARNYLLMSDQEIKNKQTTIEQIRAYNDSLRAEADVVQTLINNKAVDRKSVNDSLNTLNNYLRTTNETISGLMMLLK
jgi:hypothetical protein